MPFGPLDRSRLASHGMLPRVTFDPQGRGHVALAVHVGRADDRYSPQCASGPLSPRFYLAARGVRALGR
jgi:hypothetical protein